MKTTTACAFLSLALYFSVAEFAGGNVAAAYVPVYGGPEYVSSAGTGYLSPMQAFARGNLVNNGGTAVGWANRWFLGNQYGERAVRWDASGTIAIELGLLGTDS